MRSSGTCGWEENLFPRTEPRYFGGNIIVLLPEAFLGCVRLACKETRCASLTIPRSALLKGEAPGKPSCICMVYVIDVDDTAIF